MSYFPLQISLAGGPVPTPPATLLAQLLAYVASEVPGYTASLPGSLIEDVSSTDVAAMVSIDQARVDAVNSVTPYGANPYILAQQGALLGIQQGVGSNGSVYVVFTGSAGYVIPPGFIVSDGSNQYVIQDGGVIATGGTSSPLYAVTMTSGTFAIPAGSVNVVVTSVPSPYTLTCTNPLAGIPATAAQTIEQYQAQIFQAMQVSISGTPAYLKTLLLKVPGVSQRLVSVIQSGSDFEVICGGGDPYQVAGAIYAGVSTLGLLTGSSTSARNITVSIYDAPNTYSVVYVNPPAQVVTVGVTWNTTLTGFTAGSAVNQFIATTVYSYINSIVVGQPINELVLNEQIQTAISSILAPVNLTTLEYSFTINGTPVSPTAGTWIIPSNSESYFSIVSSGITVMQG